jgi:hypothetical protein
MSAPASQPDWLEVRHGRTGLVLVAPHGARRHRPVRPGDGTNDLFTAAITRELAARLDACALINTGLDRNVTDCNRISDLSEQAPELLALLRARIQAHAARGRRALVVFVHGWNMALPCCDVGVGIVGGAGAMGAGQLRAAIDQDPDACALLGRWPTIGRARLRRLAPALAGALADHGITLGVGRRWPATGRDNAAQLFSGRHAEHAHEDVAWISRQAARGLTDGVQLELGIPLRWPGRRRRALMAALEEVLADAARAGEEAAPDPPPRRDDWALGPIARVPEAAVSEGWSLEAVATDGTGIFAGVESTGPGAMAARLCLVLTDGRMLLFVGEGHWAGDADNWNLEGFGWRRDDDGAHRVTLDGAMIAYAGHDAYADLERGLASAGLAEARASLLWRPEGDDAPDGARGDGTAGPGRFGSLQCFVASDVWEHRSPFSAKGHVAAACRCGGCGSGPLPDPPPACAASWMRTSRRWGRASPTAVSSR